MQRLIHVKQCLLLVGLFFVTAQNNLAGMSPKQQFDELTDLFRASQYNETTTLNSIKNMANTLSTLKDRDANTLLYYALINDRKSAVKELINKGANVNDVGEDEQTALHVIAYNFIADESNPAYFNHYAQLLFDPMINPPIKIDAKDDTEMTALHVIAQMKAPNNAQFVKMLCDHGAKVNVQDKHGNTPLHYASQAGNLDVVKILLEYGANATIENKKNKKASQLVPSTNPDIQRLFSIMEDISGIQENLKNKKLKKAITEMVALLKNEKKLLLVPESIIIKLIKDFPKDDIDASIKQQSEFLCSLADNKEPIFLNYAQHLLDAGADINGLKEKCIPLHIAIYHHGSVKFLLEHKAEVNIQDKNGQTALHLASEKNDFDLVKLLIEHGADPEIENKKSKTASEIASDDSEIQNFLWETELITEIKRNVGKDNKEAVRKMIQFFEKGFPPVVPPEIVKKYTREIQELIPKIPKEFYNSTQKPIFPFVAKNPKSVLTYAESLINAGADINAQQGMYKITALHQAAGNLARSSSAEKEKKEALEAVKLLIKLMMKHKKPLDKPFDIKNSDDKTAQKLLEEEITEPGFEIIVKKIGNELIAEASSTESPLQRQLKNIEGKLKALKTNLSSLSDTLSSFRKKLGAH